VNWLGKHTIPYTNFAKSFRLQAFRVYDHSY
jgi:hypothetical protein